MKTLFDVLYSKGSKSTALTLIITSVIVVVITFLMTIWKTDVQPDDDVLQLYAGVVIVTGVIIAISAFLNNEYLERTIHTSTDPLTKMSGRTVELTKDKSAKVVKKVLDEKSAIVEIDALNDAIEKLVASDENANSQMHQLIRGVKHDTSAPLSKMIIKAEKMIRGDETDVKKFAEYIIERCMDVNRLIANNADMATNYSRDGIAKRSPFEAKGVILEIIDEAMENDKELEIDYNLPETPLHCLAHEVRFRSLVYNLVSNAVKYTPAKGKVIVSAEARGDNLVLKVSDTGCGISADDLPHIFEKNFRAESAKTLPGDGQGLSLVESIRYLYDGKITCESTVGHGSTFTVSLPIIARAASEPAT